MNVSIHATAKFAPELSLLVAMIAHAVDGARAGDVIATLRLRSNDCLVDLIQLAPDGVDPRCLLQRLLMKLEARAQATRDIYRRFFDTGCSGKSAKR